MLKRIIFKEILIDSFCFENLKTEFFFMKDDGFYMSFVIFFFNIINNSLDSINLKSIVKYY